MIYCKSLKLSPDHMITFLNLQLQQVLQVKWVRKALLKIIKLMKILEILCTEVT